MANLNDLEVFTEVVEAASFTAAAKRLGVPTSTVSRRIARLEERLDARLLERTTRSLRLTDAGRIYYERGRRIVADVEEAERAIAALQGTPKGRLRITMPPDLSGRMWGILGGFLAEYPEVALDIDIGARRVDMIEENFDLAIRGGNLTDVASSFVVRKLAQPRRLLVASPTYLQRAGVPSSPAELREHACVVFPSWAPSGQWQLKSKRKTVGVPVKGRVHVNDLAAVRRAAIDGFGIAQLLEGIVADDLEAGRLEEVLPGSCLTAGSVAIIYPSRQYMRPAVRACVDFVAAEFRNRVPGTAPNP